MSAGHATAPHSPRVRRSPAPRAPRRVSGPGRTPAPQRQRAAAVNGGAVALPQPGRRRAPAAPRTAPRALDALRRLPDARWLDRLLRGQTWVLIIGVALMGIVAMQVSLLKMNAGIGRAVEHAGTLERQNADLRAAVSQLSSEERIQREAGEMGLVLPPAGDVRYVQVRGAEDARKAADVMRPPSPPQPQTQAQAAVAGGAVVGATTADGVTPAAGTAAAAAGTTPGVTPGATDPAAGGAAAPGAAAPGTAQQPHTAATQPQQTGATTAPAAGAATPVATGASVHGATPRAASGDGGRKGPSGGTSPEGATSGGAAG